MICRILRDWIFNFWYKLVESFVKGGNDLSRFKVITLCGSTKFKEDFEREQKRLTLEGNIVLSLVFFGHSGDSVSWDKDVNIMLKDMHFAKIDMSDEIFVINKGGYIGESTKNEINYAKNNGKIIKYMESVE